MKWLRWSPLVIVVVAGIFFALMLLDDTDRRILPSALKGESVPTLALPLLSDPGTQLSLAEVADGPYLLNVWGTWCVSCRAEHAQLVDLAERGIVIIGLNYRDEDAAAKEWLRQLGNPYRLNLVDYEGDMGLELGVTGAPETFFIDANGIIQYRHVGVLTETNWSEELEAIYSAL